MNIRYIHNHSIICMKENNNIIGITPVLFEVMNVSSKYRQ